MKIIRYTYMMLVAALTVIVAACSSDNDGNTGSPDGNGMATVSLRIGTAGNTVTRASDGNANDDELMNIWTVVIADASNRALKVLACKPTAKYREIDPIEATVTLPAGTYHFYSFANMSVDKVKELLGITFTSPTLTDDGTVAEATDVSGTVDANKDVVVNGNGFDPTAEDNGFGAKGIPMSNKQTFYITGNMTKDLIVVRMLAKMEIQITNSTGNDVTVNSAVLSGVTGNVADNLMLLPKYTDPDNADKMEAVHGDIKPNLNGTPATVDYSMPLEEGLTIAKDASFTVSFYINESQAPAGGFTIALQLDDAEYRYSIIDDNNKESGDDGKWDYIARNDYRIIPIVLDAYKLELVPYDFPPIGVLPVSVKEVDKENHIYQMTFHDYGHFHLVPKVTDGSGNAVAFNDATKDVYWKLNTDWANSWLTYDKFGGTLSTDNNHDGFYVAETPNPPIDGSENGGIPVLDTQTTWNGFSPFIFGNIAKPGNSDEKSVYHEFKIKLYVKDGTNNYERYMIYRFNMVLSDDRMLSPAKRNALPRRPH